MVLLSDCRSHMSPVNNSDSDTKLIKLTPVAQSLECLLWGMWGHRFEPRLQHTKVIKNCTSSFSLWGRARTGRPSVRIMWLHHAVWYHIKCLGHDTSVQMCCKVSTELPLTTRHRHDVWKIAESDVKPEQANKNITDKHRADKNSNSDEQEHFLGTVSCR